MRKELFIVVKLDLGFKIKLWFLFFFFVLFVVYFLFIKPMYFWHTCIFVSCFTYIKKIWTFFHNIEYRACVYFKIAYELTNVTQLIIIVLKDLKKSIATKHCLLHVTINFFIDKHWKHHSPPAKLRNTSLIQAFTNIYDYRME